jgi:SAM-dependent methyltransferase
MKGPETLRSDALRASTRFYETYMSGVGLDIGFRGNLGSNATPVLPTAIGVDTDFPGYDGINLPWESDTLDYVFASHVLEHVQSPVDSIKEWARVIRPGGYLIICVPHQYLYEKRYGRPSIFNGDHKWFFTPARLLEYVELALKPNTHRIRSLRDNDLGYNYSIPPEKHCAGAMEIELVIQKITPPTWEIR